jgi:hypothetical protein
MSWTKLVRSKLTLVENKHAIDEGIVPIQTIRAKDPLLFCNQIVRVGIAHGEPVVIGVVGDAVEAPQVSNHTIVAADPHSIMKVKMRNIEVVAERRACNQEVATVCIGQRRLIFFRA